MLRFNDKRRLQRHTLYHYPGCLFCTRVRFALWRMGLEVDTRDILANREFERELVKGGGRRQVPCLRIENSDGSDRWLYESGDIIAYLRTASGR